MKEKNIYCKIGALFLVLTMLSSVLPISIFASGLTESKKFGDIPQNYWARKSIFKLAEEGIVNGYEDNTFKPDKKITRGEFISIINRSFKFSKKADTKFSDVSLGIWCYKDISIAVGEKYASGYPDGTFKPNSEVTRAEATTFLAKIFSNNSAGKFHNPGKLDFKDEIPSWARDSINLMIEKGYVKGYPDGTFRANESITRAEVCALIDNAENGIKDFKKPFKEKDEKTTKGNVVESKRNSTTSGNGNNTYWRHSSYEPSKPDKPIVPDKPNAPNKPELPDKPSVPDNKSNSLKMSSVGNNLYLIEVNKETNKEEIKNILSEKYLSSKNYCLGKVFKDSTKVLLYAENLKIKCDKFSGKLPEVTSGIYMDKDGDFIAYDDQNPSENITLFVGEVKLDKPFKTSKVVLGLKGNQLNGGLDLQSSTKRIEGLNFFLEKTPKESMIIDSAISQSGSTKMPVSDLEIINNTFNFGNNAGSAKNGIRILSSLDSGYLKINNNTFNGLGADIDGKNYNNAAIGINTRTKDGTLTEINGNKIQGYGYHGIGVAVSANASLSVEGNILEDIGQNGIDINLFGRGKDIIVKNNIISKYGSKEIKTTSFTDPNGKVGNRFEVGLGIAYVDKSVYGVKINEKYYNDKDKFLKDLFDINIIGSKAENDKNDGVFDCTPIYMGHQTRFKNPVDEINREYSRLQNEELIIVKDDDKDLVIPNETIKSKQVKAIKIVGNGSGKVVLNPSLVITDDLTIDLPNANLQNNANVEKEKVHILNIRDNDYSNFVIKPQFTNITLKNAQELPVEILEIEDKTGNEVTKEKSTLTNNIKVFVGDKETRDFRVDEENDKVILNKTLLDNLMKFTSIKIEYKDDSNNVSSVQKSFDISVDNNSSIKAEFIGTKEATIYESFAPNEGLNIRIQEIKDASGNNVEFSKVNFKEGLKVKISYGEAKKEDFVVNGDTITIKKSFLDMISTPVFGKSHDLVVSLTDLDNNILDAKATLKLNIVNNSNVKVEPVSTLTFTQGNAPINGMTFKITSIRNSKGQELGKNDIDLENCLDIEPFPTNWGDDSIENLGNGNFRFNKKYLDIDSDKKTITIKKEYLDKLQINDKDTEFGTKQIIVKYRDPRVGINFRSEKFIIHIKKALKPLSEDTAITSTKYEIKDDTIKPINNSINNKTSVSEFIKNIVRGNERQVLRVYSKEYINNNNLVSEYIYKYKKNYENIGNNDYLVVTAENGKNTKIYQIIFEGNQDNSLVISVKDKSIVSNFGTTFIEVSENATLEQIKNALEVQEEANIKIVNQDGEDVSDIKDGYGLIVQKGEQSEERTIKLKYAKKIYRALIVANSDYGNDKLNLIGPKTDKVLMKKVFENQEIDSNKFENITVVENAKKQEFLNKISEAFKGAKSDDVSYLYYSGHGNNVDGISYICTTDYAENKEKQVKLWISVNELREALDKVPGTKVLILDSCNSGGFIGKKVDAVTSPTPQPSLDINSKEFNDNIQRAFDNSLLRDRSVGYLTTNEYKVLTASSEDEYSFEDKKEKVGKFTKVLSRVAGINGDVVGDTDNNGKISLEEAYKYLEDNVVYTSHIQAFPRNDSYTIFEAGSNAKPISNDKKVTSAKNSENKDNLNIIINGDRGLIKSGEFKITDKVTVAEFLKQIQKGHPNQELKVVRLIPSRIEKKDTDMLEKLDYLEVTAEDGTKANYVITVEVSKEVSDLSITSKKDNKEIGFYTIIPSKKTISSSLKKITENTTVEEFLSNIEKGHAKQSLCVADKIGNTKNNNDKLASGDKLIVRVETGEKDEYTIILEAKKTGLVFRNSAFTVETGAGPFGNKIKSGTKALDTNVTVEEFLRLIENKEEFLSIKVNSGMTHEPKVGKEKLEQGDYVFLAPKSGGFPQRYNLIVKVASFPSPGIEVSKVDFGDNFTVDHDKKTITSGRVKITTELTVGEFLGHVVNSNDFSKLEIRKAKSSDKLKEGNTLRIIAKNDPKKITKVYTLIFDDSEAKEIHPDFGEDFIVDSSNKFALKIKSQKTNITRTMTVKEFLSKLRNKDKFSSIKFKRSWDELTEESTLKDGDKMQVTINKSSSSLAPVSETKTYIIEIYKDLELEVPDFGGAYKFGTIKKNEISGDSEELTTDITVKEFIGKIKNADKYDSIKIQKAYEETIKKDTDKIESDDKLILKKGNKEAVYKLINVTNNNGGISIPSFSLD